jgi:ABC-type bacteriocin/lantibiotic exporter with double-glycine peptidase domain
MNVKTEPNFVTNRWRKHLNKSFHWKFNIEFLQILIENLISLINSFQQLIKHVEKTAFEFYLQMAKTKKQ